MLTRLTPVATLLTTKATHLRNLLFKQSNNVRSDGVNCVVRRP